MILRCTLHLAPRHCAFVFYCDGATLSADQAAFHLREVTVTQSVLKPFLDGSKGLLGVVFFVFVKFLRAGYPLTRSGLALRLPKNTLITTLSARCLLETCASAVGC